MKLNLVFLFVSCSQVVRFAGCDSAGERPAFADQQIIGQVEPQLSRPGDVISAPSGSRYHLLSSLSWWRALEFHSPPGPLLPGSSTQQHFSVAGHEYYLERLLSTGANGQVFRAVRVDAESSGWGGHSDRGYVVKRMYSARSGARQSGLREAYFGEKLNRLHRSSQLFARFVEHWVVSDSARSSLWLAFRDEGISLHQLLYDAPPSLTEASNVDGGIRMLQGSTFFHRLHLQPQAGTRVFRRLLLQLLQALHSLHSGQLLHRDVKPGNLIISVHASDGLRLRLADFGSAVDLSAEQQHTLYPGIGPSQAEETAAYAPPEVRLSAGLGSAEIPFDAGHPTSYDVFSAGIVALETLLGEPAGTLFAAPPRMQAVIAARNGGSLDSPQARRELLLAGLRRFCILPPMPPGAGSDSFSAESGGCDASSAVSSSEGSADVPASRFPAFRAALRRALWRRHYEVLQRAAAAEAAKAARTAVVEAGSEPLAGLLASVTDALKNAAASEPQGAVALLDSTNDQPGGPGQGSLVLPGSSGSSDAAPSTALQLIRGGEQALDLLRLGNLLMPPDAAGADDTRAVVPVESALLLAASDPAALALVLPSRLSMSSSGDVAALQSARSQDLHAVFDAAAAASVGTSASRALPAPGHSHSAAASQLAAGGVAQPESGPAFVCAAASAGVEGDIDAEQAVSEQRLDRAGSDHHEDAQGRGKHDPRSSTACPVDVPSPLLGAAGEELLFRMLAWHPHDRITAEAALQHRFFADEFLGEDSDSEHVGAAGSYAAQ